MTEPATPPEELRHHLVAQAPVPPLDVDGMQAVTVGTTIFALASVVLALFYDRLTAAGNGWWLGVTVSGVVLGLVGLVYCRNRRRRREV